MPQRQTAQKLVTLSPRVRTISTIKQKKDAQVEPDPNALIGVQITRAIAVTTTTEITNTSNFNRSSLGVKDAFFGVPEFEDSAVLPDLGHSREITNEDILNQPTEAVSTEEELDAADALLSLSNVRENFNLGLEDADDNSLLMPIGGNSAFEDVAPERLRLGQVEVDSEIAKMLTEKEQNMPASEETPSTTLPGVPTSAYSPKSTSDNIINTVLNQLPGVPGVSETDAKTVEKSTEENKEKPEAVTDRLDSDKGARPKTTGKDTDSVQTKTGSCGAFRSQLYGLRRPTAKDRSYRCKICGKSKRSSEGLNDHHRRRHGKQECEICGKKF